MIKGFEEQTHDLTDYEKKELLPRVVEGIKKRVGERNVISSKEIISVLQSEGYKINGPRLRKLINYIRVNRIVRRLMATSKGYYIELDDNRYADYLKSLEQRIEAISAVYKAGYKDLTE